MNFVFWSFMLISSFLVIVFTPSYPATFIAIIVVNISFLYKDHSDQMYKMFQSMCNNHIK